MSRSKSSLCVLMLALAAVPAVAQEHRSTVGEAGHIASQPARDVGISKAKIPAVLQRAAAAPYSDAGTASCGAIKTTAAALSEALGPDYGHSTTPRGSRTGAVARVGGQAAVDSLIPFRGVVREVSGAAGADRRLALAVQAGFARRGYLHGLYTAKRCSPAL